MNTGKSPIIYILAWVCSVALLLFLGASGFLVYDGGSDNIARHLIKGTFNQTPEFFFPSFGFYVGSSHFLQWCYLRFPQTEWFDGYSLSMLALLSAATLACGFFASKNDVSENSSLRILLLLMLLLPSILLYELTKSAILLAFTGSFLLSNSFTHKSKTLPVGLGFLILAFMLRVEGGFLGSFLYLFFYLLFMLMNRISVSFFKYAIPVFLIPFSLVYLLVNYPFTDMDSDYVKLRPYQFTLWDFGFDRSELILKNAKDSMILKAGTGHFLADPEYISQSSFERMNLPAKDKTLSAWYAYLKNPQSNFMKMKAEWIKAWPYTWPVLLSVIGLLFVTEVPNRKKQLIYLMSAILVLLLFSITMKLERHLVQPVFVACGIWLLTRFSVGVNPGLMILAFVLQLPLLAYTFGVNQERRSEADLMHNHLQKLKDEFPNREVYLDLYTQVKTHIRFFEHNEPANHQWKSFDNGILFLYPSWIRSVGQTGKYSFKKLINTLNHQPESVFVFAEGRAELITEYVQTIHEIQVEFQPIESVQSPFSVYRMKSFQP